MMQALAIAATVGMLALAVWALVLTVLNRALDNSLFFGLLGGELIVLILVGSIVVAMVGGERPGSMATFISYLVLIPFILPAATVWALIERSRWGSLVIAVACLIMPVLFSRLDQVWVSGG